MREFACFALGGEFSGLLFVLTFLALAGWSAAQAIRKKSLRYGIPLLLVSALVLIVIQNNVRDDTININPLFKDSDLIGRWSDGTRELVLNSDGTISSSVHEHYATWQRQGDFYLVLLPITTSKSETYRVMQTPSGYVLAKEDSAADGAVSPCQIEFRKI